MGVRLCHHKWESRTRPADDWAPAMTYEVCVKCGASS